MTNMREEGVIGGEFYSEFSILLPQADIVEKELKGVILRPQSLSRQIALLLDRALKLQKQTETHTFPSIEEQVETTASVTDFVARLIQFQNNKKLKGALEVFAESPRASTVSFFEPVTGQLKQPDSLVSLSEPVSEQPKRPDSLLTRFFNAITAPFVWLASPFVWLYKKVQGWDGTSTTQEASQPPEIKFSTSSDTFSKLGQGRGESVSVSSPASSSEVKSSSHSKSQSILFLAPSPKVGEKEKTTPSDDTVKLVKSHSTKW